jgi:hypothetical protein
MILWANSHGGFLVGFIFIGVYLVDSLQVTIQESRLRLHFYPPIFRSLVPVLVMCLLAVCINPYGPVMLLYPFKTVGIGALRDYIQEWQSPDFHSINVQPFIWLLLLTLGAVGVSRKRLLLTDFLLVSGFAYMSFLAGRNIALFALVAPMVVTRYSAPVLSAIGRSLNLRPMPTSLVPAGQAGLNLTIAVILILAVFFKVSLVYPESANLAAFEKGLPVAAVDYLKAAHPPGALFNSYNWGGYLLWAIPEYPVFVDGRTDLFNDQVIGEWLQVVRAEAGWESVLDRWGVHLILVEPSTPLVSHLMTSGWHLLYSDEVAVIYGR